jgi:hypothetical protein
MRSSADRPWGLDWLIGACGIDTGGGAIRTLEHAGAEQGLETFPSWAAEPRPLPQLSGHRDRIDAVCLPPCDLVTASMQAPVVGAAQRDCILIAHSPPEGARLGEPQMMGVRRPSAADQAWLRRHELEVRAVAVAAWFAHGEGSFVDVPCHRVVDPFQ